MTTIINLPQVEEEIKRISHLPQDSSVTPERLRKELEKLVDLTIKEVNRQKSKSTPQKSLKLPQLKQSLYDHFQVANTDELKKSDRFKMATDGMDKLDFSKKETWEILYRKWIDILPEEKNQEGYGCINGIDIFKYNRPWQIFGLDGKTATEEDLKKAYRQLSKVYHPDNQETGDREIFERLEKMYESLMKGVSKNGR
ncbi:DnaJ domain-containing protein [Cyanobacterium aponinum]|uniref:DnaJ domain-containing protein n=1 Tax=Cyanobacterium aponinum TaxID=379064 RepID=UPI000C12D5FD|nr:DnaJ domain-containing protein [Cyanobacterium aponinum]PHV64328.1 molecular chaperone DnaJ [Cyanobacterium aponinum IPPAS B-1201]